MLLNLAQFNKDDCKLNTTDRTNTDNTNDTDNTNNEFGTWFWDESADKTDLDIEEERNNNYENDLKRDKSKTEKIASFEI